MSAQCVCLATADVFPSVRVRNIRGGEGGVGVRNRGMVERKSTGLLRGREDRGCERGREQGGGREAHLYAGNCVPLV